MIMQSKVLVDWEKNMRKKDAVANKGLMRGENRINHDYIVGDYVMIKLEITEQKRKLNAP